MHLHPDYISAIVNKLDKKINLLIVDDYPIIRNALQELFSSPIFHTFFASSEKEARKIIPTVPEWHAWLLDISMENDESGLLLLADNQHFPYTIMLSGIRSMNISSKAMQLGAHRVFDKEPDLLPVMHRELCSLAALAYILKGTTTKYFPLFKLLLTTTFSTADDWAQAACLTKRQLERICTIHPGKSPRNIVPMFYAVQHLLQNDGEPAVVPDENDNIDTRDSGSSDTIKRHIAFVYKNLDTIFM